METVDALAKALKNFRGGVMVITHSQSFVDEVCSDVWEVKDGSLTARPINGEVDSSPKNGKEPDESTPKNESTPTNKKEKPDRKKKK
jgi:ATPase subunit of ABC transporter with duplicated ATPase domains